MKKLILMMLVLGLGVGHLWGAQTAGKGNTNSKQSAEENINVKAKGDMTVGDIGGGELQNDRTSLNTKEKAVEIGVTANVT